MSGSAPAVPTGLGAALHDCDSADKGQLQPELGRRSVDACYDQVSLAREDRKILDLTGAPR